MGVLQLRQIYWILMGITVLGLVLYTHYSYNDLALEQSSTARVWRQRSYELNSSRNLPSSSHFATTEYGTPGTPSTHDQHSLANRTPLTPSIPDQHPQAMGARVIPNTHNRDPQAKRLSTGQQVPGRRPLAKGKRIQSAPDQQHSAQRQCTSRGYVMALSYHDQVTCASGRVAVLQCWAHKYRMSVVEPFLPSNSSFPGMPHPGEPVSQSLRFGDMFDVKRWNHYVQKHIKPQLSPTVTWEEFVDCAPRKVIAVQNIHREREPYSYPCTYPRIQTHFESVFAPHGFYIVKWVCINLADYGVLTLKTFREKILGVIDSRRVTLIFDQWRGIHSDVTSYASNISIIMNTVCNNPAVRDTVLHHLTPSKRIMTDVRNYEKQYLSNQPYTSVMIRLERLISCSPDHGPKQMEKVRSVLTKLRGEPVFLTMDTGAFGSQSFSDHGITPRLISSYNEIVLESLYGEKAASIEEYEQRFENVSYSSNPAYISTLQKTLAARGQCMYMFGSGSFQQQAQIWHRLLHGVKDECVYSFDKGLCSIHNTLTPWQTWQVE